jgi:ABC-2 type transport system permease protein
VSATHAELTDMRGPSATGGTWRRFFHLTWLIASTDFKLTYFGSVLGYLWSLMRPLLFFGVLYVVFALIVNFGKGVPDYPVILLQNIVLFSFFQEATGTSVPSVLNRENLVRKMHFPRLVIPLATVLASAFNLGLNLIAVLAFMLIYGVHPRLTWLLLPFLVLFLAALATGIAMALSALYVRYRDVAPIWTVVSQALFYASPVFYVLGTAHTSIALQGTTLRVYLFNPIAAVLTQARRWVIDPSAPSVASLMGGHVWVLVPIGLTVGTCVLGYWIFNREAPRIAEEL